MRLFCFPPGGAGASIYRSWSEPLGSGIQVIPVQFPAREDRYADEPLPNVFLLVEYVRTFLGTLTAPPGNETFAFFGHSLGALVSFEVARDLRRIGAKGPSVMFISGYPAPHLVRDRPSISHLSKDAFLDTLAADFDLATQDRTLLEYAYPALRADVAAVEGYQYVQSEPLGCRIVALGGEGDREATPVQLLAWQRETANGLKLKLFPGGHFYINSAKSSLGALIREELGV
jgi:medium-chain acyl-[acyl-carrier-protein] hydrolase